MSLKVKEGVYGSLMRMETISGDLTDIIEDMDVTCTTMNLFGEIHTIDEGKYKFRDYNNIDEVVVPEDGMRNVIPGM